jgi:hypothetical protein
MRPGSLDYIPFKQFKGRMKMSDIEAMLDYVDNYDPARMKFFNEEQFRQIMEFAKALQLYSAANVATVRDPEKFDEKLAKPFNDAIQNHFSPLMRDLNTYFKSYGFMDFSAKVTKDDYKKANYIIKMLPRAKRQDKDKATLYRGLYGLDFNTLLNLIIPGSTYSLGELASASTSLDSVEAFITGNKPAFIVYTINNPQLLGGTFGMGSGMVEENEVLIGGKIRIDSFTMETRLGLRGRKLGLPKVITEAADAIKYIEYIAQFGQKGLNRLNRDSVQVKATLIGEKNAIVNEILKEANQRRDRKLLIRRRTRD